MFLIWPPKELGVEQGYTYKRTEIVLHQAFSWASHTVSVAAGWACRKGGSWI